MAKFLDECMDSGKWMTKVGYKKPIDNIVTLDYLDNERHKEFTDNYFLTDCYNYLDYPLSETNMLADEDHEDMKYVLVRFLGKKGNYEYRWCEI